MSKSPEITISSSNLRMVVENALNIWVNDTEWAECERLAREKLERIRVRNPDETRYGNNYLITLTIEIYRQKRQVAAINADAAEKMRKRGAIVKLGTAPDT